uniref:Uncharacterized protein n=1 Tax=Equus asinus asinus TaxID=83772 RepID=A0A8C4MNV7_EQUAS
MILMLLLCLGGPLSWGLLGACAQALSSRSSDSRSPRPPGVWRAEAEDTGRDPTGRWNQDLSLTPELMTWSLGTQRQPQPLPTAPQTWLGASMWIWRVRAPPYTPRPPDSPICLRLSISLAFRAPCLGWFFCKL